MGKVTKLASAEIEYFHCHTGYFKYLRRQPVPPFSSDSNLAFYFYAKSIFGVQIPRKWNEPAGVAAVQLDVTQD